MTVNSLKAEKILNFKDKTYKARMSLDTIMRVEEALGTSILKVGNKLTTADITLLDIITILTLSVRAGGNDITESDIKKHVSDIGLVEAMKLTGELLTLALNVDTDDSEKKSNP
tara:strand:+ start:1961 stop:2302 length:342 start_codon:yes stop_codon:yes gene_type:complete